MKIRHAGYRKYMGVTDAKNWPCAHLFDVSFEFSITDKDGKKIDKVDDLDDEQWVKIKTHDTMHPNYEWAYAADAGKFAIFSSH